VTLAPKDLLPLAIAHCRLMGETILFRTARLADEKKHVVFSLPTTILAYDAHAFLIQR
jgi:hypothetical protein